MTVYVVGSVNVDERLSTARIPSPGETVIATSSAPALGGKGANQAVAAAAAGARTVLVGMVGDDELARLATDELSAADVDTTRVDARPGTQTGRAVVMVDDGGENAIVVVAGANGALTGGDVEAALHDVAPGDVVVLQNEVPAGANHAAAAAARLRGATSVWNAAPSPARRDDIVDADILVVNAHELADIAHLLGLESKGDAAAEAVARALGSTVICTRGADGALLTTGEGSETVPSLVVDAVDTTAAGDATVGYFAATLDDGPLAALRRATVAGALTVTRPGASSSIPHAEDVERALARSEEKRIHS